VSHDGGYSQMNEESPGSGQSTVKKRKTSAPVPPDDFVVDRIKTLNGSPLPCAWHFYTPSMYVCLHLCNIYIYRYIYIYTPSIEREREREGGIPRENGRERLDTDTRSLYGYLSLSLSLSLSLFQSLSVSSQL
jgi:hypothetical protein